MPSGFDWNGVYELYSSVCISTYFIFNFQYFVQPLMRLSFSDKALVVFFLHS